MSQLKREIKITDKHGFHYNVIVKHDPNIGVSIAYHDDIRIASREYGRCCRPPVNSDDDQEWEEYEQRLHEFADEIESDLNSACTDYFNKQL